MKSSIQPDSNLLISLRHPTNNTFLSYKPLFPPFGGVTEMAAPCSNEYSTKKSADISLHALGQNAFWAYYRKPSRIESHDRRSKLHNPTCSLPVMLKMKAALRGFILLIIGSKLVRISATVMSKQLKSQIAKPSRIRSMNLSGWFILESCVTPSHKRIRTNNHSAIYLSTLNRRQRAPYNKQYELY